jgi:Flp pilus assembly protein TadG
MGGVTQQILLSKIRASHRSQSGQSLVEFALVAPVFFLLVFGVLDFGRLFFTQMTLQHALREAGRFAVTGNTIDPDGAGPLPSKSRIDSIKQIATQSAAGINVTGMEISSGGVTNNAGGPDETVTVSLRTELRLITPIIGRYFGPDGIYTFTVSTTFKNEPFPPETN